MGWFTKNNYMKAEVKAIEEYGMSGGLLDTKYFIVYEVKLFKFFTYTRSFYNKRGVIYEDSVKKIINRYNMFTLGKTGVGQIVDTKDR